ncbi:MarR family transcriptional regulator [Halorubrum lacusprofundi]
MSATTDRRMLDKDDLSPADDKLLDLLREGRVTAPFAADETGYSLQYIRDRLGRLVEHGNARKVYDGLYELVEDPREETDEHD